MLLLTLHMKSLTSLNRSGQPRIGVAGARAIANSPHMKSLTSLDLSWSEIGDEGAQAIANSEHMASLTSLNLLERAIMELLELVLLLTLHI